MSVNGKNRWAAVRVLELVADGRRLDDALEIVLPLGGSHNRDLRIARRKLIRRVAWAALAASVTAYSRAMTAHARNAAAWIAGGWNPEVTRAG